MSEKKKENKSKKSYLKMIILVITILLLLGFVFAFFTTCNPSIQKGYNVGIFANDFEGNETSNVCGIFVKKTKNDVNKDVSLVFSYGYLKEENYTDFNVRIYIEDYNHGMHILKEEDIANFYTEDYKAYKPGLLRSEIKYNKYETITLNFKDYTYGKVVIVLSCLDSNKQQLKTTMELNYEKNSYDQVVFS